MSPYVPHFRTLSKQRLVQRLTIAIQFDGFNRIALRINPFGSPHLFLGLVNHSKNVFEALCVGENVNALLIKVNFVEDIVFLPLGIYSSVSYPSGSISFLNMINQ